MTSQISILSTKKLTKTQENKILKSGIHITHFDILKIDLLPIDPIPIGPVIITSSNAIPIVQQITPMNSLFFVVGSITAQRLKDLGYNVAYTAENAIELAHKIIQDHSDTTFTYLCGVHRRDELPQALKSAQISCKEIKVYNAQPVMKTYKRIFDAVLCYSPRGVHAFAKANPNQLSLAVCIGETTAAAAREHTNKVIIAEKNTINNTIDTAIKALQHD